MEHDHAHDQAYARAFFPQHHTVRVGQIEAYVAEAGHETTGTPPIVLLHGNPDTHAVWGPVVERLAPTHRCLAPDLPGFGRSQAPDDLDYSLATQGAFVRDLLTALELRRVHLVVHDVGGSYGLAFACEYPERIATLTIFNTNFFPDYRWHFWARVWRTRGLGELAMKIANRPLFVRELRRGSPRIPMDYAAHAYSEFTPAARRAVLRWYRAMDPGVHAGWDEQLLAATAKTPKQVLWGDLDPFIPASTADRFGGVVTHLPDCGHWAMLEEPERSADAIASLAARRSRTGSMDKIS
jgi:pimeloyl-ACP methyl ester carboxylesterase